MTRRDRKDDNDTTHAAVQKRNFRTNHPATSASNNHTLMPTQSSIASHKSQSDQPRHYRNSVRGNVNSHEKARVSELSKRMYTQKNAGKVARAAYRATTDLGDTADDHA
jgi:hypothetical protein